MNKTIVGSIVGTVILAAMVLFLAIPALRNNGMPSPDLPSSSQASSSAQPEAWGEGKPAQEALDDLPQRPDCPVNPVVDLPCLGGKNTVPAAHIQIYNVWAWWCAPCRDELPLLDAVARKNGWQLVGVHADKSASFGANLLEDLGVDMPSYQDFDNTFAGTLGLPGVIPITVVMVDGNKKGQIVKAFSSEAEAESAIKALLS